VCGGGADHKTNLMVLLAMLKRLGYGAETAVDGLEAVKASWRHKFDVILMVLVRASLLCIDDNETVRSMCAAMHSQCSVDGTASAHKAVQSFEKLRATQIFFKYYCCHILKTIIIQAVILIPVERSHLKMVMHQCLLKYLCYI
jgi:CheY-like chemotaxis protein